MRGTGTVLEPVAEKGVKCTQTVWPSVDKGHQKTPKVVLPPISNSWHGKEKNLHTLHPTVCMYPQKTSHQHAIRQQAVLKEKHKVKKTSPAERPAKSPEAVLRDSKPYLTEYELEEIKDYKQVWYLGKKANKTRYSKVTSTQDIKPFNFGYDTREGFYKAIINDHLAYRFQILEVIGTGYSGQVFKCTDHKTMEVVAVKVIRTKDSVHQLGKAEVKILEALRESDKNNTANIVHMKENFYFRTHLCITFELFEKDLYRALKDTNQHGLNENDLRKYTTDVLKCLQMLKKKSIIHGDLKPDNILLYTKDKEKRTAVGDFGGSYYVKHRDQPLIHTLCYMSPEMLLGKKCSPATDMWSLGCILAELHLGRRLFHGRDHIDQFSCIMKVLGSPPTELLVAAPKRKYFFYSNGIPLKIKDITGHSTTLANQLNSKSANFLDFIERCLVYDPTKRITPEEALQHPWICKQETRPVMSAGKTGSVASLPSSSKTPALLRRKKIPPLQLQPIRKTI